MTAAEAALLNEAERKAKSWRELADEAQALAAKLAARIASLEVHNAALTAEVEYYLKQKKEGLK